MTRRARKRPAPPRNNPTHHGRRASTFDEIAALIATASKQEIQTVWEHATAS